MAGGGEEGGKIAGCMYMLKLRGGDGNNLARSALLYLLEDKSVNTTKESCNRGEK